MNGGVPGKMKEYKVILGEDEIEILINYLNSGELDSPTIEDAILRGILHQIQNQEEVWLLWLKKKKRLFMICFPMQT